MMGFVVVVLVFAVAFGYLAALGVLQLVRPLPCPFCDHTYRLGKLGEHFATAYCQEARSKLTARERYERLARML
jgi:hypothetical protein